MWRATIKGIFAHKLRLGLTALAVVLGVGFVTGTYILTDTMNRAFDDLFRVVNQGVAVSVGGVPKFEANLPGGQTAGTAERVPASLVDTIRAVDGVRAAEGSLSGYAQLVGEDGEAITTGGAPTFGVSWAADEELNPSEVKSGRGPQAAGEIAVDAATARRHGLEVGDRVTVLLQGPRMEATIVGIFGFGEADNLGGATVVAFHPDTAQSALNGNGTYDSIEVAAEQGVAPEELRRRIQRVLPEDVQAKTGEQAAQDSSDDLKQALSFFNIVLLVFAAVALFVGAFIIFNTFQILVTQRTRELALLRALGASSAQIRRSVILEAIIVGIVASLVGLAFGLVIAVGLQALLKVFGIELPSTALQILPRTIVVALVVGIGTTLASSIMPSLRASRIAPIAALRDPDPPGYFHSRRRTLAGAVVIGLGAALLMLGLFGGTANAALLVGLGAALVFFGVAVLGPVLARPIARLVGAPLPSLRGISGKLGLENAVRNPKRTSSTAAALMIGLGLVAFVSIFAASIKSSSDRILEETLKADYIVSHPQFMGFSQEVAGRLRASSAFSAVAEFRPGVVGLEGRATPIQGVDPVTLTQVATVELVSGSAEDLGQGEVLVFQDAAESNDLQVGSRITFEFSRTGEQELIVAGIYANRELLGDYVISLETYQQNFTEQLDIVVLAKTAAASQREARAAVAEIGEAFPNVRIQDQAEFRESQRGQVNQLLGIVTALLGLSIFIALFGIINTLALSVFERTREIGLLRAVGLARRQVRSMIRWEAVIIAVFGALLGTVVGIFFGWAMVQALEDQGITVLSVPAGQLAIYILLAGVIGVIAAVFPAWRATKLDVLKAIVTE
ncbi:MAG: ABC transporter permease [Actinomycetota bacterium]